MSKITEKIKKNSAIRYFVEAFQELQRVSWPKQNTVIRFSVFVIALSAIFAVYFGALDWASALGVEELVKLVNKN